MFGRIPNIQFIIGVGADMADKLKPWPNVGNQLGALLVFGKRIAQAIGYTQVKQSRHDILCRLQLARAILRTFHDIPSSVLVDDS